MYQMGIEILLRVFANRGTIESAREKLDEAGLTASSKTFENIHREVSVRLNSAADEITRVLNYVQSGQSVFFSELKLQVETEYNKQLKDLEVVRKGLESITEKISALSIPSISLSLPKIASGKFDPTSINKYFIDSFNKVSPQSALRLLQDANTLFEEIKMEIEKIISLGSSSAKRVASLKRQYAEARELYTQATTLFENIYKHLNKVAKEIEELPSSQPAMVELKTSLQALYAKRLGGLELSRSLQQRVNALKETIADLFATAESLTAVQQLSESKLKVKSQPF